MQQITTETLIAGHYTTRGLLCGMAALAVIDLALAFSHSSDNSAVILPALITALAYATSRGTLWSRMLLPLLLSGLGAGDLMYTHLMHPPMGGVITLMGLAKLLIGWGLWTIPSVNAYLEYIQENH